MMGRGRAPLSCGKGDPKGSVTEQVSGCLGSIQSWINTFHEVLFLALMGGSRIKGFIGGQGNTEECRVLLQEVAEGAARHVSMGILPFLPLFLSSAPNASPPAATALPEECCG